LLVAVAIFYIFSPQIMLLKVGEQEKVIKFESARVTGWNKGVKSFELYSKNGWAAEGGNTTYFEDVTGGKIFEGGKIIARDISAFEVRTFRRSEAIEAYAGKGVPLRLEINLQKEGSSEGGQRWAAVSAKELKYDPGEKKVHLLGDLALKRDDMRIFGESLTSDTSYDIFYVVGNVSVSLPGKIAFSENAEFIRKEDVLTLHRGAKLVLEKGGSFIKEEDLAALRNPEAREALEEKTVLECKELKLFTKTSDALAEGDVSVTQKERSAKADRAEYLDPQKIIILTGNVFMKKGKDWIRTEKVIVSVKDETFEASGRVETEFKLKK
ncbi:MAG: hypothetical protein NT030_01700, partial [Candidatus Saganbacteria bacterium]|nr:hypothetical protein [Candidatus Saganbacteria bacterium]